MITLELAHVIYPIIIMSVNFRVQIDAVSNGWPISVSESIIIYSSPDPTVPSNSIRLKHVLENKKVVQLVRLIPFNKNIYVIQIQIIKQTKPVSVFYCIELLYDKIRSYSLFSQLHSPFSDYVSCWSMNKYLNATLQVRDINHIVGS